jgi:hypothetical protein
MTKIYVWIKNNEVYMWTKDRPKDDWCDAIVEADADLEKYFIVEYDQATNSIVVVYKDRPVEESKIPFLQ